MKKFILALLLFSSILSATDDLPPEFSSYCFLPTSQISMLGQLDFEALRNSGATTTTSNGYLYIEDAGTPKNYVSILVDGDMLYIQFTSNNISYINSRLEYLNSLNIFLIEDEVSANVSISSVENASCRQIPIIHPSEMPPLPMIEPLELPAQKGFDSAATESQTFGAQRANDALGTDLPPDSEEQKEGLFSLEQMLLPLFLGAVSTLFLIIVAVYFRGNFFKPVDYPSELTIGKTQLEIIEEISDAQKIPTDIANRLGKSKSTVIEHLENLQKMGMVEKVSQPGRKFVYYKLSHEGKTLLLKKNQAA